MNTIKFAPQDFEDMLQLMDRYEDFDTMLMGTGENDECVTLSVYADKIIRQTYQENGWIRISTYWRDGTIDEEFKKE